MDNSGYRFVTIGLLFSILVPFAGITATESEPKQQLPDPQAVPSATGMTVDKLESIIKRLDSKYQRDGGMLSFDYGDQTITVITDASSDRMRVIIPVMEARGLDAELLYRIMQANFDSALDARYGIAKGVLWSTFLHPLGSLTEDDFLSGIGQSINIVSSFGSTYSSGLLTFGGGDSDAIIQRQLIDELIKRGRSI